MKLFIRSEHGRDELTENVEKCDQLLTSRLSYPELRSALAKANRDSRIDNKQLRDATSQVLKAFNSEFFVIEIKPTISTLAGDLTAKFFISGADAVQLASALTSKELIDDELVFSTWDRRLWQAAADSSLTMLPTTI